MHIQRALRLFAAAFLFSLPGLAAKAQTPVTVAGTMPGQFSVSESGAATYRIPIQVPPGIAGMEPKLELAYNSQGGNGMLGMGWSLGGLSAITRCPATMTSDGVRGAVNHDLNDRFCLDGQRLILVAGSYGVAGSEYRTELESFSKITAYGAAGNGPASFTVKTKAGLTVEYGNTADSRIEAIKASGSTAAWPAATVRVWAQNKVSDVKGNYMTLSYDEDVANGAYYPKQINYTGNASSSPALTPMASVQFVPTTTARTDVETGYQAGAMMKSTKRIGNVKTFIGATLVKDYRLVYDTSAATNRSWVTSVQECSSDGVCLLAESFGLQSPGSYTPAALQSGQYFLNHPYGVPGWVIPFDFNGDGRQDIAIFNSSSDRWYTIGLNNGDGTFKKVAQGQNFLGFPYGSPQATAMIGAFDYDGDGKQDLLFINSSNDGWYMIARSNGDGAFTSVSLGQYFLKHPYGVPGWVIPFDFNGDGRQDIAIFNSSSDRWYTIGLNNGDGTFKKVAQGQNFLGFPYGSPQSTFPIIAADFNQDGKTDLAFFNNSFDRWYMFALSNGDGTFRSLTSGQNFLGFPYGSPQSTAAIMPIDYRGNGHPELLFFNDSSDGWYQIAQVYSGAAPDLLGSITNGLGAKTDITLLPLTAKSVYTKDSGANASAYPQIDLQFPLYVVSSVASSNGVGGVNTSSYSYGGLKAEQGTGRGMLGFRWMKSKEEATGIERYTEFSQAFPYTGMPVKSETRLAGSAGVLKRTSATPACKIPLNGAACVIQTNCHKADSDTAIKNACATAASNRYFPYVATSQEDSWDLNGAAYPSVTSSFVYGQSPQYGDPTQITVSTSGGASKTTNNEYYPADTLNWVLGRLKKASVTSVQP